MEVQYGKGLSAADPKAAQPPGDNGSGSRYRACGWRTRRRRHGGKRRPPRKRPCAPRSPGVRRRSRIGERWRRQALGSGRADALRSDGIDIVQDLPGVGGNLQEHSACSISRLVNVPTLNSETRPIDLARHFTKFFWNRSGPLSAPAVQAMAFAKTMRGTWRSQTCNSTSCHGSSPARTTSTGQYPGIALVPGNFHQRVSCASPKPRGA